MIIQKIGARVLSPIKKLHKMQLYKKLAKLEANIAEESRLQDEFLLKADPKLIEKREAVINFVNKTPLFQTAKSDFQPTLGLLNSEKSDILIAKCGDNLEQIKELYGDYGLAQYARLSPQNVIGKTDSQIFDIGYEEGKSISHTFREFLLNNQNGFMVDIQKRFGQSGNILYNNFSRLGFVKGCFAYDTTAFGKDQIAHHQRIEKLAQQNANLIL